MPSISLCMIACNEGETLARAIESALPACDEVVIGVDMASTDDTYQIARAYATPGKLFQFQWEDDFSAARNQCLQRASGDLIWILDSHEYVPNDSDPAAFTLARMQGLDPATQNVITPRAFFADVHEHGIEENFDVACVTLGMNPDQDGVPGLFFLQPRIFRRGEIHYEGGVHNHLGGHNREQAIGCPLGLIIHDMPPKREKQRKKQRRKMNIGGLRADVKEERQKPVAERVGRPWFYLGNTYSDMGEPLKAKKWYLDYLKYSKFGDERRQALQQLAVICFRHQGADLPEETDEEKAAKTLARAEARHDAKEYALQAMALGWRQCEPILLLAEIAEEEGEWEEVLHWCKLAGCIKAPASVMFMQGPAYTFMPHAKAMRAYTELGNWMEAIRSCEQALSWQPHNGGLIQKLDALRQQQRDTTNAQHDCNMLVVDRIGSFTADLAAHFGDGHNVVRRETWDDRWRGWADIAWFEWCDQNIIGASRVEWRCPLVVRLHSYEAFADMPEQVNWKNVAALVFVADHIRDLALQKWPQIAQETRIRVIPNGVSTEGLTFSKRSHGKRIGFLGYLNGKKGVETMLELMRRHRDYEWHIAGEFQDAHLAYWFKDAIADLPQVWYHGWVDPAGKDAWLDEIDYLLSPSVVESFGYSIAEAMLKGIKPLVRYRQGASELWPSECIWRDVDDFERLLQGPYDSAMYRDWVLEHYSLDQQFALTDALLAEVKQLPGERQDIYQNAQPIDVSDFEIIQPAPQLPAAEPEGEPDA